MTLTATSTPPRCDATNTRVGVTEWGTEGIPCQTRVGLRSFVDRAGTTRYHCSAPEHRRKVERRYGIADACAFCRRPLQDGLFTRIDFGRTGAHDVRNVCDNCVEKAS